MFNHVLTYKGDLDNMKYSLHNALQGILETLTRVNEPDALTGILLAEIRIIYKNPTMLATTF